MQSSANLGNSNNVWNVNSNGNLNNNNAYGANGFAPDCWFSHQHTAFLEGCWYKITGSRNPSVNLN